MDIDQIKTYFDKDIANHKVTTVKEDGLYRHLICSSGSYNQQFEIITWPGYLAYVGDMGSFTFCRLQDMFPFFRDDKPNFQYYAQKLEAVDKCDGYEEFDVDKFRQAITQQAKYSLNLVDEDPLPEDAMDELYYLLHSEDEFDLLSSVSSFESDTIDLSEWYEYGCKSYTVRYVWACFAIQWAIREYDNVNGTDSSR